MALKHLNEDAKKLRSKKKKLYKEAGEAISDLKKVKKLKKF